MDAPCLPAPKRRHRWIPGVALCLLLGCGAIGPSPAFGARASVELLLGAPVNAPGPLHIEQAGHPDLDLTARWETRPFEMPFYYALRIGVGTSRGGWGLDLMHHKLDLENNPAEVQSFTLTHGYNILTLQHLWRRGPWQAIAGAGVLVPHVENTIRQQRYPENRGLFGAGYHLAGPAIVGGVGRRVTLAGPVGLMLELRATVSRAWVDVVDGEASLTHLGVHFMAGLGFAPR